MYEQSPRVGIALSGGTLKAATHVGILWALEQAGITPDCIAGTSAGSLIGALYTHGYRTNELAQVIKEFPGFRLLDYGFPFTSSLTSLIIRKLLPRFTPTIPPLPSGLLRGKKLEQYIRALLRNRRPTLPLFIVATDLITGSPVVFHSESKFSSRHQTTPIVDLPKTIVGSCALPGIFTPVQLHNYLLIDGAFRHYVPVTVLREFGCKKIIAINLYRLQQPFTPVTFIDVLSRSFDILLRETIDNDLEQSDNLYVIEPDLRRIKWRSFLEMEKCVSIGRDIIVREIPNIRSFLV